jgi:hypothetical protein
MKLLNIILSKVKSKTKSKNYEVEENEELLIEFPGSVSHSKNRAYSNFELFLENFPIEIIGEFICKNPGHFINLIQSLNWNIFLNILKNDDIYHHFNNYICPCSICYNESIDSRIYFNKTIIESCQNNIIINFLRRQYQQFKFSTRLMIKMSKDYKIDNNNNNNNNNNNYIIISLLDRFLELEYKVLLSSWIGNYLYIHNIYFLIKFI